MHTFQLPTGEVGRRLSTWFPAVSVVLVLAGCSGDGRSLQRYAVKGKVLLVDGKPLTAGRVTFMSDAPPASAATDIGSDGAFEFKGPSGDGLPEAKYRVQIAPGLPTGNASGGQVVPAKLAFASKYLDEDTSGLTATVTSDESKNQFEFKLETKNATGPASRGNRR